MMKTIKRMVCLMLAAAILAPAASCSRSGKIVIPPKGCEIGFREGDVYRYDMDLTLDTEEHTISGHVDFEFFNDSDSTWQQLCLRDYPSLFERNYSHGSNTGGGVTQISNITDSRTGSLDYERDDDDISVIWIDLDTPLKAGNKMTLSYDFTAVIPHNVDRFGYTYNMYNVTNFYPILAEYTDEGWSRREFIDIGECFYSEVSDYRVTLHVPSDYVVASTGEEVSVTQEGGGLRYEIEAPCVRDFVFCASDELTKETIVAEGVTINVFSCPGSVSATDMAAAIEITEEVTGDALLALGEAFGRYPYGELDIMLESIGAGAGMEYPSLVMVDNTLCYSYLIEELESALVHEIGHQWFMGIVGSDSAGEPWLDESFASYSELVYYEYLGGEKEEANTYEYSRASYDMADPDLSDGSNEYIDLSYEEFSQEDYNSYVLSVYYIGKMVLYQMEETVGREEFHSAIRAYVHRYAFRNATTADFLEVLYAVAGKDNKDLNNIIDRFIRTRID